MKAWKIIVLILLCSASLSAQSIGPNGSMSVTDGGGGNFGPWSNPNLGRAQDDLYASMVTTDWFNSSYLLFQDFSFSIPAGSSINGIVVGIDRYATTTASTVQDNRVLIIDAYGNLGSDDKSSGTAWANSDTDTYTSYGANNDTWGIADWTAAKINSNNFGVAIRAWTNPNLSFPTFSLYVDHVRVTVYYTIGGSQRYAVATGNWSNPNTWATTPGGTPGAGQPTAGDDVFIGGGFTVTQNIIGAVCNSLTLGTSQAMPAGILTFNNNNRDIAIGDGGLVITTNGDIISTFTPTLTSAGDFTLNKNITNRNVEIRMDGNSGLIINGTGSLGYLNVQSSTTNTGTITISRRYDGVNNQLVNGATGYIIYSGTDDDIDATIDMTTVGNTIEIATTSPIDMNVDFTNFGNTFHHFVISNNGVKRYNGPITINGNLTITATGILNNAYNDELTLFGNWTNNNGALGFVPNTSIVHLVGGNSQTITNSAGQQFYRLYVNKTTGTIASAVNNINVTNRLRMTEGIFDVGSRTLDGTGELDGDGGELRIGTLGVTVPQLTTYAISGGTITFNGAGTQTIRSTPAVASYFHVQVLGSGTKSLSGVTDINGNLTIGGTATLDATTSNFAIRLAGNWANTSSFAEQSATVTLDGASLQTITNATGETFYNLIVTNSSAANSIVLNGPVIISNAITFTDGHIVTTASNLLTLNVGATVASVSDASHVHGPVAKIKNTTTVFAFPTGDGSNYMPASVTPTSTANTTYVAQYFSTEQTRGVAVGTGIDHISSQDYWTVERTNGTADAAVTLSWEYASVGDSEINSLADLRVAQWSGTLWANQGNTLTTGAPIAGSVKSNTISSFAQPYFVIASATTNNPLSNNRYFVATTGNWNASGVWAYRPSGPATASEPTATKNAFVLAGNTVTIQDVNPQSTKSVLSLTLSGTLAMSNAGGAEDVTLNVGAGGLTVGSGANITGSDGGDEIRMGGNIQFNNSGTLSHTNLEVNFTTQSNTISGTGSIPYLNANQNNQNNIGNITIRDLGSPSTWTNEGTITITGSLSGGGSLINNPSGAIIIQTTSISNTVLDATAVGNTVRINNTTGSTIELDNLASGDEYHHLIISGTTSVTHFDDLDVNGDFTIQSGAIFNNSTYNQDINLGGSWINNNGVGGFIQGIGDIIFDGNTPQSISISSGTETFANLEIDNSGGGVTLAQGPLQVTSTFNLTQGIVHTTTANLLILSDNINADEGHVTSYVSGPMKKIGNDAYTFPVGDGTKWARLRIENLGNFATTTEFTCQYIHNPFSNIIDLHVDVAGVSNLEHWLLDRTFDVGNDASCRVRLYWENQMASDIHDPADLRVAHYYTGGNGLKWYNFGATYTNNGDGSGNVVSTTMFTSFSPITFASAFGFNPLPIELEYFNAVAKEEGVQLNWKTVSELNNDFFTVERSRDGESFAKIEQVPGAGTSKTEKYYSLLDDSADTGRWYYRLKQTDYDGHFTYSNVVMVDAIGVVSWKIYPNPTEGTSINVRLNSSDLNKEAHFTLHDITGKTVFSSVESVNSSVVTLQPSQKLRPGVYILSVLVGKKMLREKIVVQ